jgi:hypothetical protein
MAATEMERIYLLKSQGVDKVVSDINAITEAFERSAKAKAALGSSIGDATALGAVNAKIEELVANQQELLAGIKNVDAALSKSNSATTNYSQTLNATAQSTENMAASANQLGSNLINAAGGVMKLQTNLGKGNLQDYDSMINKLVFDLAALNKQYAANKLAYEAQFDNASMAEFRERQYANGATIDEVNQVVRVGKVEVEALTNEYRNLLASIGEVDTSYEAYLKMQMEITAQTNQLVTSIQTLNTLYNPAVSQEYVLALQKETEAQKLNAAATEDAIAKQAALNAIKTANKKAVTDKMLVDQYGVGGNEGAAKRKRNMEDDRKAIELAKNKSIVLDQEASYYQRLLAQVNTLRLSLRLLSEEEMKNSNIAAIMQERVAALDNELRAFNRTMGDSTRDIGKYEIGFAGIKNAMEMFGRQFVRAIGSLIIWQVLFDGITKVGEAIAESIPGTEAYIQKQEKLQQATESLISTFKSLFDEMQKVRDMQNTIYEDFDKGVDAAKRNEAYVKAQGITNGQIAQAEDAQAKARIEVLKAELVPLKQKQEIYDAQIKLLQDAQRLGEEFAGDPFVQSFVIPGKDPMANDNVRYEIYKRYNDLIEHSGLSAEFTGKMLAELNKEYESGGNLLEFYVKTLRELTTESTKNDQAIRTNTSQQADINQQIISKNRESLYQKGVEERTAEIEMQEQLAAVREQYRLLREHGDAESIDKIVHDTEAKYGAMIRKVADQNTKIRQDAVQYAKSISLLVPDIAGKDGKEDFDAEYKGLPDDIKALFEKRIKTNNEMIVWLKRSLGQDETNRINEYMEQRLRIESAFDSQIQSNQATAAAFDAKYGKLSYSKMASAITEAVQAKQAQIEAEYVNLNLQYKHEADKLVQLEQEKQVKLLDVEKEAYKQRLQLGTEYFNKLNEGIQQSTAIQVAQLDNATQIQINKLIEQRLGKVMSQERMDMLTSKLTNKGIIAKSEAQIEGDSKSLKAAKDAEAMAELERDAAGIEKSEAEKTGDKAKIAAATDKLTESEKAYSKALADRLLIEGKITKAEHDRLVAMLANQKNYSKQILSAMITVAQTLSDNYFQLLAKQDAYRHDMADRALDWNKRIMDSEVQSKNQMIAEDRAYTLAKQKLDKDKAESDKKRAEQAIWTNAVIASGKALAQDAPDWPKFAIDESVILAQTVIQEAMLAKAPAYGFGTGDSTHPGGPAWVGDRYSREFIKLGSNFLLSPAVPTLTNLPAGAQVFPIPGNLGTGLKAPSFSASSYSQSGGGTDYSVSIAAHDKAIKGVYGLIGDMAAAVANIKVDYNAKSAGRAALSANLRNKRI